MVREVIAKGKLEVSDVVRFMLYHNYTKLDGALTGIFGVIALFVAPVMFYFNGIILGSVLALFALMYIVITPLGFYVRAKKQMRTNPVYKNDMAFTFASSSLSVDIYTGKSELLWQDIFQIKVFKTHVLIYIQEASAFIIPISHFDSTEGFTLVADFVQRNRLNIPHTKRLEVEINDEEI